MNYKLTIHPDMDSAPSAYTTFIFSTRQECIAAKDTAADLLLFMQDQMGIMDDSSNAFYMEEKSDDGIDWEEFN